MSRGLKGRAAQSVVLLLVPSLDEQLGSVLHRSQQQVAPTHSVTAGQRAR